MTQLVSLIVAVLIVVLVLMIVVRAGAPAGAGCGVVAPEALHRVLLAVVAGDVGEAARDGRRRLPRPWRARRHRPRRLRPARPDDAGRVCRQRVALSTSCAVASNAASPDIGPTS